MTIEQKRLTITVLVLLLIYLVIEGWQPTKPRKASVLRPDFREDVPA